ncbi:MAG TPA: polysaccharide biosynthesis protein [Actinomycetes bacterium]|nr:polysaccharide biosynthesis protein [Actinomycetes bacterium]
MSSLPPSRASLAALVAQRERSLFAHDVLAHADALREALHGRRVLVIGGAGSIGSATVHEIARVGPAALHVVDVDENGLAEVARDLHSSGTLDEDTAFRTTPLDFGGRTMRRLLDGDERYDLVLNFAAIKHVRSEKDVLSLLRMLEINVVAARRLLERLAELGVPRYFAVSTDKAANPVNLMGASKRAMELVMLDDRLPQEVTSARFANVAFSNGSLLDGWLRRLDKRQPWAVPVDTRRYFVTPEEAGQLCCLAASVTTDRRVVIPALDPDRHLRDLVEVAVEVMGALGLEPDFCDTEEQARDHMQRVGGTKRWPLLLTPLDTAGEKAFEEFVGTHDTVHDGEFSELRTLTTTLRDARAVDDFLGRANDFLDGAAEATAEAIGAALQEFVPELQHRRSDNSLDQRM